MTQRKARILVCDDEAAARRGAIRALGSELYELEEADHGRAAVAALKKRSFDLVLLDLRMPVMDGNAALAEILSMPAPPPVIVVTADASLSTAIEAVKSGAEDFIAKPYEIDALRHVVKKTLEKTKLAKENRRLGAELSRLGAEREIVGESEAIRRVISAIDRAAPTEATVLLLGESGTGKELLARRLHRRSTRAEGPFVTVNCSAIPDTLVESELFGHLKGAFTGADRDRHGKFREADGGTLFLDEIGDMALSAQSKLLRALQEGEVEPLGGGAPVSVDVRVVAATHRDLKKAVERGTFREDLLFRLKVVDILVPPLRERLGDVVVLARRFLAEMAGGRLELSPEAESALVAHEWPGNVRELRNAIERASIFCSEGVVLPDDLPRDLSESSSVSTAADLRPGEDFQTAKQRAIERFEREVLTRTLSEHDGNVSRAARALGLHRQNLQQKLRALDISAASFRSDGDPAQDS